MMRLVRTPRLAAVAGLVVAMALVAGCGDGEAGTVGTGQQPPRPMEGQEDDRGGEDEEKADSGCVIEHASVSCDRGVGVGVATSAVEGVTGGHPEILCLSFGLVEPAVEG